VNHHEGGSRPPHSFTRSHALLLTEPLLQTYLFIDRTISYGILAQRCDIAGADVSKRTAPVKFPVVTSTKHKGKTLEVDTTQEVITLVDLNGEPIGSVGWDALVDQILIHRKPQTTREARVEPRISLSIRVRYNTPEGTQFESRAGGIGGGGLFIESFAPLAVGTKLTMEFRLPETQGEWLRAKGVVAWICPRADQYTFSPGMGIRFTDIAPETRNLVLSLVRSVKGISQDNVG